MIEFRLKKADQKMIGCTIHGHAGFARKDEYDLVCAAVSVLSLAIVNGIERHFGEAAVQYKCEEGFLDFNLLMTPNAETDILMDTMVQGMKDIEKQYPGHLHVIE